MSLSGTLPAAVAVGIAFGYTHGNRCGHNPSNPRLEPLRPAATNVPPVLRAMLEKIQVYFDNPDFIPSLNGANGSTRQQRSERREACVLALGILIKYLNIITLRCEIPTAHGFMALTIDWLAKQAGLTLRRMERAIHDLKSAGLIEVKERSVLRSRGHRGVAAVKSISRHLFALCGLKRDLEEQAAKKKRYQEREASRVTKETEAQEARNALRWKSVVGNALQKPVSRARPEAPNQNPLDAEHRHQFNIRCLELRVAHPDWSDEDVRREAGRFLPGHLKRTH